MTDVAGHFGEWFQGLDGTGGDLVAVTVRCSDLAVRVERLSDGELSIESDPSLLSLGRAESLLARLGLAAGGFSIFSDMPPGGGAGASTAALIALARAAGYDGEPAALAAACLAVEGATDPLMLDAPDAVLWAPRRAAAVEVIGEPPDVEIVGGFWGKPVWTEPDDYRFADIADLIADWRCVTSVADCAAIATEAARRTTALRGPDDDPTADLARSAGALGWLRAHTGSARGLIFQPGAVPADASAQLTEAGLEGVIRFRTGGRT